MSLNELFSQKLRQAREEKGYTQDRVAEIVCISVRWYQQIETGDHLPGSEVMLRLLILLELDPNDFKEVAGFDDSFSV